MKKIRILLVLALIISAMAVVGCSNDEESSESENVSVSELFGMVPENTQFLVKFEALEKFYDQFAVAQNSIMEFAVKEKDIEQIKTVLGFNPLNVEEVRQTGLNLEKPFCLAGLNMKVNPAEKPGAEFDIFALLPVSEGAKALDTIRSGLGKNNILFVESKKDDVSFIKWSNKEEKGCLAVKDQYLYMTINSQSDPQLLLESIIENNSSLTSAKAYGEIASDTDFTRDLLLYFNIADMVEANSDQLRRAYSEDPTQSAEITQMLESIRQYSSASVTADLGSPDLSVNTVTALVDDAEMKNIWNEDYVNRQKVLSITDPAAMLLSLGMDIKGHFEMISEMLPPEQDESLETRMDAFREKTGFDLETELLDNLSGSINLGLYDGASITMFNYNALFTAGVRDEKLMRQSIDKAINLLPPDRQAMISRQKIGKADAYVVNAGMAQMYAGVDDNKLLLASGKPTFEKALNGETETGFAQDLTDDWLKDSIMSNSNIFYLNIDELIKTVNNFSMFLVEPAGGAQKFQEKLDAAGRFEYVLTTSKLDKNVIKSLFFVKTRFSKPFAIELTEMINEFNPES